MLQKSLFVYLYQYMCVFMCLYVYKSAVEYFCTKQVYKEMLLFFELSLKPNYKLLMHYNILIIVKHEFD